MIFYPAIQIRFANTVHTVLLLVAVTSFCLISSHQCLAQSDSLVLINGDIIVGEVKELDRNILLIKTVYSNDDIEIKWHQVSQFYSSRVFLIYLDNGSRMHHTINSQPDNPRQIVIGSEPDEMTVHMRELVGIFPVTETFLGRLSASVSIGYNYAKNNSLSQISSRIGLRYQQDSWGLAGTLDMVTSSQDNTPDLNRTHGTAYFKYYLRNDWFLLIYTDLLSNDQQKLKLRTAVSAGIGKFLIHNNCVQLSFSSGGVLNNETYTEEGIESNRSQEVFLGGQLDMFNIGNFNIFTYLFVYPSISEHERLRSDLKMDLKYDLPLDFYINLGYTLNYDNQPVEGASKTDYILQTTLGWHFH